MTENQIESSVNPGPPRRSKLRLAVRLVLPLLIILAGMGISRRMMATKPTAKKRPARQMEFGVQTQVARPSTEPILVSAMGEVVPAREIVLRSRVGGEVAWVDEDFVEGGLFGAGDELLKLDPVDYELAVASAEANLARSDFDRKLELGQQKVATREWELLSPGDQASDAERELALRKPHLARVEAEAKAAAAQLQQAQLDLERTTLRAPFDAVVQARMVDVGARVSTQDQLAMLVGTDAYWVRAAVPVDRLGALRIPGPNNPEGSAVRVVSGTGEDMVWAGRVVRLLSDLELEGRMAQLLVEVDDPLGLKSGAPPNERLLLGSYVRLEMEGVSLDNVTAVPRQAIHNNNRLWVVAPGQTLDIREVEVVWRGSETVLVRRGLDDGERYVVSGLSAPVQGMRLRAEDQQPVPAADGEAR